MLKIRVGPPVLVARPFAMSIMLDDAQRFVESGFGTIIIFIIIFFMFFRACKSAETWLVKLGSPIVKAWGAVLKLRLRISENGLWRLKPQFWNVGNSHHVNCRRWQSTFHGGGICCTYVDTDDNFEISFTLVTLMVTLKFHGSGDLDGIFSTLIFIFKVHGLDLSWHFVQGCVRSLDFCRRPFTKHNRICHARRRRS